MFASFQATEDGLTHVAQTERAKLTRSDSGCLPCRRKRKKCDNVRPRCGRCCHSHKHDVCIWPSSRRARSVGYTETRSPHAGTELDNLSSSSLSPRLEVSRRSLTPGLSDLSLADLPPAALPEIVTNISPGLSFADLLKISLAFQHRVLSREQEFEGSLFLLGFQAFERHPALLHAWIAASVAVTSPSTPKWKHQALMHHVQAVEGLRKAIEAGSTDGEWQRATMLMLHIFELHGPRHPMLQVSTSHLNAAHMLFSSSFQNTPPSTTHDAMLLEGYIVRTTLNCLVQGANGLPINHIETMTRRLAMGLQEINRTLTWQHCPWIGPIGSQLVDIMYRLSWLAHRLPPSSRDQIEAEAIRDSLAAGHNPPWSGGSPPSDSTQRRLIELTSKLHWHATSLLADLVGGIDLQTCARSSSPHFQEGLSIVAELSQADVLHAVLVWPLVILSIAIDTHGQMKLYKAITAKAWEASGLVAAEKISADLVEGIFRLRLSSDATLSPKDVLGFIASSGVLF